MKFSPTLNRYMATAYIVNLLLGLLILLGVVYLFDTVELLRRAAKREDVPFSLVMEMGLLKLPEVGQVLFPFAVLFSAIFTFWQMTRRYELIVVRAAGLSVWQFLAPVLAVAMGVGILMTTLINPLGALLLGRFEHLESTYLNPETSQITLLEGGLWLRQQAEDGHAILHAGKVSLPAWELHDVMVIFFGAEDRFLRRIDAPRAELKDGQWLFRDAISNEARQARAEKIPLVVLPTTLTAADIEESFAAPQSLSFWKLPGFIRTMEATGFDSAPIAIHFHSLLAQPLLFAAMILLAASVSLRPPRFRGTLALVTLGILIGFLMFFLSSFLQALGATHQIPVFLAAWATAVVGFLLGLAVILNLEDG